jgi:hypothetical protein
MCRKETPSQKLDIQREKETPSPNPGGQREKRNTITEIRCPFRMDF